jgi:short-subunit dehydrogenase
MEAGKQTPMKFTIKDKVAVITGASSGIGKATAIALAQNGAKVVLCARSEEKLIEVNKQCLTFSDSMYVVTDISKPEECERLINLTIAKHDRLDVLVSNAGLSMRALTEDCSFDVYHKLMDVNFFGAVYCSSFALPHLLSSRGMLVGISSISGIKGLPGRSGYTACKAAINGFFESVKIENLKTGLHVLTICPGFTSTDIRFNALDREGHPQGFTPRDEKKMMEPEEVAKEVITAMKKKKNFVVLTNQGKLLVGLNKFFPNLVSKLVFDEMANEPNSPLRLKPITTKA